METMQWSEISTLSTPPTSVGVVNGIGGNDQRNHNHPPGGGNIAGHGSENGHGGTLGAPTIKNHSVTYFNDHLYCFGGYDGRRNHNLLLLYNIREHRWIRPQTVQEDEFNNSRNSTDNDNNDSSFPRIDNHESMTTNNVINHREDDDDRSNSNAEVVGNADVGENENGNDTGTTNAPEHINQSQDFQNLNHSLYQQHQDVLDNNSFNRTHRTRNNHNGFYPGIDGGRDCRSNTTYAYTVTGNPPPGRNGHSATLATDDDDNSDEDEHRGDVTGRIIILGGWLGQGPLAASDMHVLYISRGGRRLRWYQPAVKGTPPGPCNMHSADYVKARKEVFVFRGGNGREYLNDVHALHVPTMTWRKVVTTGESPQQRANHSSCILEETGEIFIFGGWNGTTRLNDVHIFDTKTCNWTSPKVGGVLPHPRAGMTLTALRGRLYLFGGSGTSSKCFQDLQILDREEMKWLDVTQYETVPHGNANNNGRSNHHHHNHQMHHPSYHQQNQFALPPQSQHYYIHSHQHQHYQHQHQHPIVNHQDNGFVPSNPQWNAGGQGYQDYGRQQHQYHHLNDNFDLVNNNANFGGNEAYTNHPRPDSFTSSRADWASRELAARPRMGTGVIASPNPNDEDTTPTVLLYGHRVPGSRAGHTATAVNRKIYVFGGSCGSDYLNDFYVLDTDPPPRAIVNEDTSSRLIGRRLWYFFNDEEFSDVTFLVQGRRVHGHKMVLAIVSDCFRAMFTAGFRESSSSEIEITGCSYEAFLAVMEYIYTGIQPSMTISSPTSDRSGEESRCCMSKIVDILELADRFFLDHLKQVCESLLQANVREDTVEYFLQVSQKTNSMQLQAICEHHIRNRDSE